MQADTARCSAIVQKRIAGLNNRTPNPVVRHTQVTNLHIRYEDSVTRPGQTFACGLTLHSMGAFTVDEGGKEIFVKKAAMALLRKAAELSRFSIYFDTGAALRACQPDSCRTAQARN